MRRMNIVQKVKQLLVRIGLLKDKRKAFLNSYHHLRALEFYLKEQYKYAADELNEELKEHPDNGFAHWQMAEIHNRQGNYGMALQACNNALKLISDCGTRYDIAHVYWLRSQVHKALNDLFLCKCDAEMCVKINPNSVNGLRELGDYYYDTHWYDKSDEMFNKIIELEPHNTYGYMGLGRNEDGRCNYEAAIKHYERAALLDSNYVDAHTFKAQSLVELGKLADAADELMVAIKIDRIDPKIQPLMERIINLGGYDVLQLKVQDLLVQDPEDGFLHCMMGWIHYCKPDFKRSMQAYEKSFEIDKMGLLKHCASLVWNQLGASDKAIECEKIAISMEPGNQTFRYTLSDYYADEGMFDEAIEILNGLIAKAPSVPDAYYRRGRCYQMQGMQEEAIKDFTTAISLKDNHAQVYMFAGLALQDQGMKQSASAMFQQIVDDESLEERQLVLGWALYELDETTDARNEVEKLVKIADRATSWIELDDVYFYAMITYCRLGMISQALDCAKKYFDRGHGHQFFLLRHHGSFRLLQNEKYFERILMKNELKLLILQQEIQKEYLDKTKK